MCGRIPELTGKVAIVTGGSSGLGYETAKKLAKRGARVVIASRNEDKLAKAQKDIIDDTGNTNVDYRRIDLASLKSVRNFVEEIKTNENRLDILINNVGAISLPDTLTEDGLHMMMQVNYFGTFLLTYLLFPFMRSSSPSRVINVSGATLYFGEIDFDHLNDVGRWSNINLLANSKLAESLFIVEFAERAKDFGVTSNSIDPFLVANTGIYDSLPDSWFKTIGSTITDKFGRDKSTVADEIVFLAGSEEMDGVTGEHYKFCGKWLNTWLADDEGLRKRLWETSKQLVKISAPEDWDNGIQVD